MYCAHCGSPNGETANFCMKCGHALRGQGPRTYTEADYTDFAHTGPGSLAGRYLRLFWQPVHRSQDLVAGLAKPIKIMNEEFTLYRGAGGTPHVVAFRCAHRGTQLSTGWVEDDNLRCLYHGWVYDGSGECIEQPGEPDPFCEKIRIRSYPTREHLGLIFAYLGEGEPPPVPSHPYFDNEEGVMEVDCFVRACNYFQMLENDDVHGAFVHGKSRGLTNWHDSIPLIEAEESAWGMTVKCTYPDGAVKIDQNGMPNLDHNMAPARTSETGRVPVLRWEVPIDDESLICYAVQRFRVTGEAARRFQASQAEWRQRGGKTSAPELAARILAGELRLQDITEDQRALIQMSRVEDDTTQIGQGRIATRDGWHYGQEDVGVLLLRKLWERELRALAEGRPLTQWHHAPHLIATEAPSRLRGPSSAYRPA